MKKITAILLILTLLLIAACSTTDNNPRYACSSKGDCYASTDTCECVAEQYYQQVDGNQCDNFGCDCIQGSCTKTAPYMK